MTDLEINFKIIHTPSNFINFYNLKGILILTKILILYKIYSHSKKGDLHYYNINELYSFNSLVFPNLKSVFASFYLLKYLSYENHAKFLLVSKILLD